MHKIFLALIALVLLLRLFIETFLMGFGSLGSGKISNLTVSTAVFVLAFFYFLKKIALNERIILPRAWAMLSAFGLICAFSIFYSMDVPSSIHSALILWSYIFWLLVLVNFLNSIKHVLAVVVVFILLGLIASVQASYEYLVQLPWYMAHATAEMLKNSRNLEQLLLTHRTPTLFFWPNILSGFLIMIIPLCAAYGMYARQKYTRILFLGVLLILTYAFFIELTISSWVSLFLGAGVLFVIFKRRFLKTKTYGWVLKGILFLALLMLVVVAKKLSFSSFNSFSSRQEYFKNAYYLIMKHPVIGNGWSSFGVASAAFANGLNGLSNYAHNSYIQIFSEVGLLGLLSFIVFLVFLWKDTLSLIRDKHKEYYWLTFALLTGLSAAILDNFFSYTMLIPNAALYWWLLVGLVVSLKETLEPSKYTLVAGIRFKICLMAAVLLLAGLSLRLTQAEYFYFVALPYIHENTNQEAAVRLFQKARDLNPWDKKFELGESVAYFELYNRTSDKRFLQLAHETVLKTMGQESLGAERQAIKGEIEAAL